MLNIIVGVFKPLYTKEQLEQIKENNANGYTYINSKGEKVTKSKYWCTQRMRDYELDIKKAKEGKEAAALAKEPDIEAQYQEKITQKQNEYTQFCKACGLKPRYENTRIYTADNQIKSVDKIAESGIIKENDTFEMYRNKGYTHRKTTSDGIHVITDAEYNKLTSKAIRQGANIIRGDPYHEERLRNNNKRASTIVDTIFLLSDCTISDVLEEVYHFYQNKSGMNNDKDSTLRKLLNEIDAQKYLLMQTERYNIPIDEVELTKANLREYEKDLEIYYERVNQK